MDILTLKLRNGSIINISKEYYDELISIGIPDHTKWKVEQGIVKVRHIGKDIPLARLIAYTIPGWRIDYHDKNPLNLVEGNLITAFDGKSKHDYRKLVTGSNTLNE